MTVHIVFGGLDEITHKERSGR